jgi:fatty acid amide hydrolase 2
MPVLRIIAGPDGIDERAEPIELGDPEAASLAGMRVVLADNASLLPATPDVRAARERAAELLADAGARVEHLELKQLRRALELYLAVLGDGADVALAELVAESGVRPGPRALAAALRGRGPHTPVLLITLLAEQVKDRVPQSRVRRAVAAARSLREEVVALIGDGLLLHHPHPRVAPRHGATVGRPWVLTPTAVFNLLGLPVTQVPLGLGSQGLPLGVQVVAAPRNDDLTIAAALELERRCGGWVSPPQLRDLA